MHATSGITVWYRNTTSLDHTCKSLKKLVWLAEGTTGEHLLNIYRTFSSGNAGRRFGGQSRSLLTQTIACSHWANSTSARQQAQSISGDAPFCKRWFLLSPFMDTHTPSSIYKTLDCSNKSLFSSAHTYQTHLHIATYSTFSQRIFIVYCLLHCIVLHFMSYVIFLDSSGTCNEEFHCKNCT